MPLYEYHCPSCRLTFEALEPLRGARRPGTCPRCRRRAPRVSSMFSLAAHAALPEGKTQPAAVQSTPGRPLCLRYPQVPLLCHMDGKSAERFVAHVQGCGAQYDDGVAARKELRKKRGEPPPAEAAPSAPAHSHQHSHGKGKSHAHGHSHARHTH
jgi:putative FmdB family regulatory protein